MNSFTNFDLTQIDVMEVNMEKKFDGYVRTEQGDFLYCYENRKISIAPRAGYRLVEPINTNYVLANKWYPSNQQILFHTVLPIPIGSPNLFSVETDWFIENYIEGTEYTSMEFVFPELEYFLFSNDRIIDTEDNFIIPKQNERIKSFDFHLLGRNIHVIFGKKNNMSLDGSRINIYSYLRCEFPENNDLPFLLSIFYVVKDVFSFLCNRRNIALYSTTIKGKINDISQKLYVYDKYQDVQEKENIISNTIHIENVQSNLMELFEFVACNYEKSRQTLSINSIPSSSNARQYIDLKLTLHIMAAFEYYQREFLPEIASAERLEVYEEVKEIIETNYINKTTGKKKKIAKDIKKSLFPAISLQNKIYKVYFGYDDQWKSLERILAVFYDEVNIDIKKKVSKLARIANKWRNELAHEKHQFQPDRNTLEAVYLVEKINYCIVLREVGYSDKEINIILQSIFISPYCICTADEYI